VTGVFLDILAPHKTRESFPEHLPGRSDPVDEFDRDQRDSGEDEPVNPPAAWQQRERASDPDSSSEEEQASDAARSADRKPEHEAESEPPSSVETPVDHSASSADDPVSESGLERGDDPLVLRRKTDPPPPTPTIGPDEELERLRKYVSAGPVVLVVPSEVFVHFYPATPDQLLNAFAAAGFDQVFFESLGDELVALAYLRLWRDNDEKRTWIRSTSPLVVEYCRERHPELLPYLAPIVPPAMALARHLRATGESRPLVYAGLDFPEVNGERAFSSAVSFAELETFLEEQGARPVDQSRLLRTMPPERRRFLAAAGGLPLAMLDAERHSSRHFHRLRGLHYLASLSRQIQDEGTHLGFIDVLPYDGALDHPSFGLPEDLYWRRGILALAEPPPADGPVVLEPEDLDLTIVHREKPSRLPLQAIQEIERALEDVRDQSNGGALFAGAADYAGYLSLTESMVRSRPDLAIGLLEMSRNYFKAVRDATHDALTDLYSYRALRQRARELLGQANRSGSKLALLFVDLDGFKEINDTHGHAAGNAVLRGVARALELAIRSTDIAGRYGGDEFVLVLVDADYEGANRVAEEARRRIRELRVPVEAGTDVGVTASIGISFHAGREDSLVAADDLFAEADAALYIAKAHGGNRVHPGVGEGTSS
jgi:diguanylate cyclase (GGDEF)-like protein